MDKTFGVAVIGCGGISRVHLQYLTDQPGIRLIAVCDVVEEKAKKAAETYGGEPVTDHRALLDRSDIDIVHLCLPHDLHAPIALDFLKAGKRVLTEKPIATTVEAAKQMIAAGGDRLSVVFQNRWNPASVMAKRMVESGEMGALQALRGQVCWHRTAEYYQVDWRGSWAREGGGVLINQAIHTIDLMLWLGGDAVSVSGSISTDALYQDIEVEDTAHFTVQMKNGVRGTFYATTANAKDAPIELELFFEQGSLLLRADELLRRDAQGERVLYTPPARPTGEKAYWGSGHGLMFDAYYAALREGKPFPIDGKEALKALALLKTVYESSHKRQVMPIEE